MIPLLPGSRTRRQEKRKGAANFFPGAFRLKKVRKGRALSMEELTLIRISQQHLREIEAYRAAFPADRPQVTWNRDRIPGLDHLEEYGSTEAWLAFCDSMGGKISWYLTRRSGDGKIVGAVVLRARLEYDDDDPEFCSHIGYSIRPDERRKGYAARQLRLCLDKARALGLSKVRLICSDTNEGSKRTILRNGGIFLDSIYGEESGITVNRYDIRL